MVDENNIITNNFGSMEATKQYKLFDCQEGNCRQTQGYVIKEKGSIYAFVGKNFGETIVGNPEISVNENNPIDATKQCGSSYYGKVYAYYMNDPNSLYGICIDDEYGIDIGENKKDKFLMLKGTAAAETPFEDESNDIVIKRGVGYIARDQFFSSGN